MRISPAISGSRTTLVYLGIIGFTVLFLLPFQGSVHLFDTDEVKCAETAREMILTGDYFKVQIDFEPFPEKPPLFFWLQVISMKLFGINEFAARFPNILCGVLSLVLVYYLGRRLYGNRFGLLWIFTYGAAILPFFYFKSGMTDPWFNLFLFAGISWFIAYMDPERVHRRLRYLLLSAFFMGLAILTKGPLALLIFLICFLVFLLMRRYRFRTTWLHAGLFTAILLVTGGSWFFYQLFSGNIPVLKEFIAYQLTLFWSESPVHQGFFGYHLVVLLLGVFPASVIALKSFTKKAEQTRLQKLYRQWMYILFWVVIILFSLAKTKLLHYSSLAYFPITFLAAWVWEKWIDRKIEIARWQVLLILLVALFHASLATAFPLVANHNEWLATRDFGFLNPFTMAALQRDVHWSGYEWLIGPFLLAGVILASLRILRRDTRGMVILHLVVLLFATSSIYNFTGRIEGYTQRAAIKFYKSLKGQDVYVNPLGFRSYAHLFYFDKQPGDPDVGVEELLQGSLDRDAYFVLRVDKKEQLLARYPELEILHEKDGYVFTVRRAGSGVR